MKRTLIDTIAVTAVTAAITLACLAAWAYSAQIRHTLATLTGWLLNH